MLTYTELIALPTFEERFNYLKLDGQVGKDTFGFDRYLNQDFYKSAEWKRTRNYVITRDLGCDLGISDRQIFGRIVIHHMNPISAEDIIHASGLIIDPEFLITVSPNTHNAIHYGNEENLLKDFSPRAMNDTCPWRK